MLQTVRCIRFGAVLMDENRRPFLLCENCHNDYGDLEDFRVHLQSCAGLGHLFQSNTTIGFDYAKEAEQLLGKSLSGAKQYLIYNFNEVLAIESPCSEINYKNDKNENYMDLIKIEEELLDPRWYTDLTSVQNEMTTTTTSSNAKAEKILEYNELVEAVTPFVQFKENVRTSNLSSIKNQKSKNLVETKLVLNTNGTKQNGLIVDKKQGGAVAKNFAPNIANIKARNAPIAKRRLSMQKTVASASNGNTYSKPLNTLPLERSNAKLQHLAKDVLQQKLPTQKPELAQPQPKPIAKRRKTIAISMDSIQLQPELFETEDCNWKRDIAQILAKPKSNLKTYQKREKPSLPQQAVKTVCFQDAVCANTKPLKRTAPASLPPPIIATPQPPQQKPQRIVITKSKPINVATTIPMQMQMLPPAANEKKQTEQILNKLQTLGLQVKRTNPPPPPPPPAAPTKADETLELLKKLQSKGMNVKILNKNINATSSTEVSKKPRLNLGSATTQHATGTNAAKSKFNKGIIIKKVK